MRNRIVSRIWVAVAMTLAMAGILASGISPSAKAEEGKEGVVAPGPKGGISGVVTDAKGQPQENAEVLLIRFRTGDFTAAPLGSTKTGADGKFALDLPEAPESRGVAYLVMASKPGHAWGGYGIKDATKPMESTPINLVLGDPKPLAGQVVSRKGEPVSGALVYPLAMNQTGSADVEVVFVLPGMEQFAAKTDAAGRFRFEQLPAGWRAGVLVRHPDYANLSVFPAGRDSGFDVGKEAIRLELAAAGGILGCVTDSLTSRPVAGVSLVARARQAEDPFGSTAITGADGRYEMKNLPPGDYTISPPMQFGMDTKSGAAGGILQPRSGVKLEEGQVLQGVDLLLKPGIVVKGRVIEEKSRKGLANVTVSASQREGTGGPAAWNAYAQTNAEGRFEITAPEGVVTLNAYSSEYRAGTQPRQAVNLKIGETPAEVVIALQGNAALRISGVVLDPAGKPVAGAIVRPGFDRNRKDARTDDAGKFDLHITRIAYPGMTEDMSLYALAPDKNLAAMIPIEGDKDEIVLKIQLKTGGAITGRVLDEEKKPLAKAKAALQRTIRTGSSSWMSVPFGEPAVVDAEGRFRISGLCDGAEYSLNVSCDGHGSERIREIKAAAGQTMERGDITLLHADVYVDVSVVDTFGNPVEGVNLYAQGEKQPEFRDRSATGKDGKLRLGPFVPGNLYVNANKQGYSGTNSDLMLTKGKNEEVRFEMADEKGASTRLTAGTAAPKLEGVDWLAGKGDLAAVKGKPVALVFFAPGNRPSMAALNKLQALQKELGEDKLAVVAVCDASVTSDEVKKLWSDKSFPFALGRVADGDRQGWTGPAFRAYEVRALPGIILINPESRIHQRDVSISDLEKAVRSLVGGK